MAKETMIAKKSLIFLFCLIFLSSLVIAQEYKIGISTLKETFEAEENISIRISLLDSQNNPINDEVSVILEDAEKKIKTEQTILSNEFTEMNLKGATHGQGTITARYKDVEVKGFFIIEIKELAKFELEENTLTITNIGNTKYTRTVQIMIGETTGIKEPKLDVGKKVSYKLVAPDGVYSIRVTDGKTTLTQNEVKLTGTGKVIGALDETPSKRSPVTGGIRPEDSEENILSYFKDSKFIYIFVFVVLGAMILLAIERRYRKKLTGKK